MVAVYCVLVLFKLIITLHGTINTQESTGIPNLKHPAIMEKLNPPSELKLQNYLAENWKRFLQQFICYIVAAYLETKPDKRRIAMLRTVAGQAAQKMHSTLTCDADGDSDKYDTVLGQFEAYCTPRTNETYKRYEFRMRSQV